MKTMSVVVALVAVTAPLAHAQAVRLGLGTGLIVPVGDYSRADQLGFNVTTAALIPLTDSPLNIRVDGSVGLSIHKDLVPGHTTLWGAMGSVLYYLKPASAGLRPYVLAGGGAYYVNVGLGSVPGSVTATKPAGQVGAGFSLDAGPTRWFVEGRFVTVRTSGSATNFVPLTVMAVLGGK